jgi:hypothetical protein
MDDTSKAHDLRRVLDRLLWTQSCRPHVQHCSGVVGSVVSLPRTSKGGLELTAQFRGE